MKNKNGKKRLLCFLLAAFTCACALALPAFATGSEMPTSLGLAEHGIKAHADGWIYASGYKGQSYGGSRASDCSGLIYAYFSDIGAIGNCKGGATSQVTYNCAFSNDIDGKIPNIHGLVITIPDRYDPQSGIYGHIGIYIGNNEATDNSSPGVNMLRGPVVGSDRGWTAWHLFDNGMRYPVEGWYAFDGKMVHYTDYEYDTDTVIDGYLIGEDGFAQDADGKPAPIDKSLLSGKYATADLVAEHLRQTYPGVDTTYEQAFGAPDPNETGEEVSYSGKIVGGGVNLRQSPSTKSAVLSTLSNGSFLDILEEETGEMITHGDKRTDLWYLVATAQGQTGYVCSLFVDRLSSGLLTAPAITASDGYVTMTTQSAKADIYYTTDGTQPSETSTPYISPLFLVGQTYKAVAIQGGRKSPVSTATVMSDSSVFTDFTADDWFFSAVDQAVSARIFHGNGDGTFAPSKQITRIQFLMALAGLEQADLSRYETVCDFTDLSSGVSEKTVQTVNWALDTGIVSGYTDNTFRPNEPITREQMCAILAKYAGLTPAGNSAAFTDDNRISSWATEAVYACRDNGLISGMGGNKFDPKGTATRAQACVITVKLSQLQM